MAVKMVVKIAHKKVLAKQVGIWTSNELWIMRTIIDKLRLILQDQFIAKHKQHSWMSDGKRELAVLDKFRKALAVFPIGGDDE